MNLKLKTKAKFGLKNTVTHATAKGVMGDSRDTIFMARLTLTKGNIKYNVFCET